MLVASVTYNDINAYIHLSNLILDILPAEPTPVKILCIGTDRVTGDAFGPLVGTFLKGFGLEPLGTLDQPVHAGNLNKHITDLEPEPFVLAIDACLGNLSSVGNINLYKGPIAPGAGVGKKLKSVGDAGITMTVNVGGFLENMVLANTRLALVYSGAQTTALGIYRALRLRNYAVDIGPAAIVSGG
ncbi:MAG TPA: spore protease YyaC [Candidatus Deferrimicrobium sp.]|nr:spore protease YyaC [Candidatus Deferrimicrobium sp.]